MKILTLFTACIVSVNLYAKPVIFDNDMAIDDWAALLFLAQHPEVELAAVTIAASGESRCKPGLNNTNALLDLSPYSEKNIQVACGDDEPLDGFAVFPEAWRVDSDTLSGVSLAKSKRPSSTKHAVDVIHNVIVNAKEPVTILATGPLTNIAQWLEQYPQDQTRVERLIIMGGNVDAPGNIIVPLFTKGHPNKTAEWNFFVDPLAADKVLASTLTIELVGLDITNSVRVTNELADNFNTSAQTPAAIFWKNVLIKNKWFIDSNEYYFWDTLAALILVEPDLCQGKMAAFSVAYEPTKTPWLATSDLRFPDKRWDGKSRQHLNAKSAGTLIESPERNKIKVCQKTRPAVVFEQFKQVLNRY